MIGQATTSTTNHLFHTNQNNANYLSKIKAIKHHLIISWLLSVCKHTRHDIQTAVTKLFICVKSRQGKQQRMPRVDEISTHTVHPFTWLGRCFSLQLLFFLNLYSQKSSTNPSGWVDVIPSNLCPS